MPRRRACYRLAPETDPTPGERVEIIVFTVVGIALYFAADWALDRIEAARGARFENRSIIFFVIILALAIASFQLIGYLQSTKP
jgi:hypothetical protein